jgi:hypothetical protein
MAADLWCVTRPVPGAAKRDDSSVAVAGCDCGCDTWSTAATTFEALAAAQAEHDRRVSVRRR